VNQFNLVAAASGYPWVRVRNSFEMLTDLSITGDPAKDISVMQRSAAVDAARLASGSALVVVVSMEGSSAARAPWRETEFNPEFAYAQVVLGSGELYLYVHELGHLFGMEHDPEHVYTDEPDFAPYRRAYVDLETSRQTAMGQARDASGKLYPAIPRFSNPEVTYKGRPTGTAERNNAWMLRYATSKIGSYPSQLK
jgi:hypothetical protein